MPLMKLVNLLPTARHSVINREDSKLHFFDSGSVIHVMLTDKLNECNYIAGGIIRPKPFPNYERDDVIKLLKYMKFHDFTEDEIELMKIYSGIRSKLKYLSSSLIETHMFNKIPVSFKRKHIIERRKCLCLLDLEDHYVVSTIDNYVSVKVSLETIFKFHVEVDNKSVNVKAEFFSDKEILDRCLNKVKPHVSENLFTLIENKTIEILTNIGNIHNENSKNKQR